MAKRLSRRRLLEILAVTSVHRAALRGAPWLRPSQRRASVSAILHGRRTPPGKSSTAKWRGASSKCARRLPTASAASFDAGCAQLFKELKNPYYLGDEVGLDPVARLGRGVDIGAERLRRRRQDDAGCRRGSQFRARPQSAAGGEGRRPQLPGIIQRRRFAARLDAPHERDHSRTTRSSAPVARAARSRSRPCRSKLAPSGAMSTTR